MSRPHSEPPAPGQVTPTARQRVLARMRLERDDLAARIVERARTEIPDYRDIDTADLLPTTAAIMDRLFAALADEPGAELPEVAQLTDYGRLRATQSVSIEGLLRSWRLAERLHLETLTAVAADCDADDAVLLEITRDLLALVDRAAASFSDAHRRISRTRAEQDRDRRAEFTLAVLTATVSATELTLGLQRYGLRDDREYRAFRARADSLPRHEFDRLLRPGGGQIFGTIVDGDFAGFTDHLPPTPDTALIAFGPARAPAELPQSFRLAGRALATASALSRTGACDFDELGLLPGVSADPELGAELVRRYLRPLERSGSATVLVDTLAVYLDTGMRVEATAQRLIVHPNTVRYRIGRFEELTGCDLRRAHVGAQVWWAIHYELMTHTAAKSDPANQ